MKLRQKLAATLAAAMVVTAVPVVTMASSTNKVVKTAVVEEDTATTDASLKIKFDDYDYDVTNHGEEFYLTLTNAKWLKGKDGLIDAASDSTWTYTVNGVGTLTYTRISNTVMQVKFEVTNSAMITGKSVPTATLPLPIEATGGTVTVAVTAEGGNSTITEGTYTVASTGSDAATLTVADADSFYDRGELAKITLKESFTGSLAGKTTILEIELDNEDFEFVASSTVEVKGTYGFSGQTPTVQFDVDEDDSSIAYVAISGLTKGNSLGRLEITGIEVKNDEKEVDLGDLLADITTVKSAKINGTTVTGAKDVLDKDYTNVVVAKIADFGAYIEMEDEKAVDIVAGRSEEVEFTIAETVVGTFEGDRTMTIELDDEDAFFLVDYVAGKTNYKDLITDNDDIVKSVEVIWDEDKTADVAAEDAKYGSAKATALKVVLGGAELDKDDANDFTVTTDIYVPIDQKDKKEIKLTASMRGVDEFKSATAVNVLNPFDVTFEQTTLKVGLQNQTVGKFTITETDKEMFKVGDIDLNFVKGSKVTSGITVEEVGDLTVTGDLKSADIDEGTKVTESVVTLKRKSKAASALTIENMQVTVDRTVPEGSYDLEIGGTAIDVHGGTLTVKDFLVIGTSNTQDLTASNGLAKGTATFAIGANTYTLNGVEATMDAASYIQDPGYTMVPVRYVAQAFGVSETDIMFGKGTVTIFAGTRTVQLTNGSDVAVVNGANVAMATKVVIKDGRTYAPIGEIAKILGVSSSWDNTTKTATFENK